MCEVRPKSLKTCERKVLCQIDRVLTGVDLESVCVVGAGTAGGGLNQLSL